MARNLVNRYVWLVDTINRYGRISLKDLNKAWLRSEISEGKPLARRTFFHYRDGVEEMFDINIQCDKSTFEYYIDNSDEENNDRLRSWLVDSVSMSGTLSNAREVSGRIMLENVPSAREHLPVIIDALKQDRRIRFSYKSYTRSATTTGIVLEPYFVKIFKQLWYVIGLNVKDGQIKTYSLDRISSLNILQETFKMPENINPADFFKDCFGIITNKNNPKRIVLRVEPTQAKYFRALPLHHSQQEEIHDDYSIFSYKMRITYDLKEELMSHGASIEVLEPKELKTLIRTELERALNHYQ
ncbi:MAG: WYL domain-containing protein [Muribaculaceae bacterium]|nr:WYL domain-containing protein [Muribaculaceae bacterium]